MNLIWNLKFQDLQTNKLKLLLKVGKYFIVAAILAGVTFEFVVAHQAESLSLNNIRYIVADNTPVATFNAMPEQVMGLEVSSKDYRALVLDKYFAKYNSPMSGYGSYMVEMCDKYDMPSDCSLLPAIAFAETKLCTQNITAKQYNCWGWGGSYEHRMVFNSFYESIDYVAKSLSTGYRAYLKRPDLISKTYCGDHCGTWAEAVSDQQKTIQRMAKDMGLPPLGK